MVTMGSIAALTACSDANRERAQAIKDQAAQRAELIEEGAEQHAEALKQKAENLEQTAEGLENRGEERAERVEERGEQQAAEVQDREDSVEQAERDSRRVEREEQEHYAVSKNDVRDAQRRLKELGYYQGNLDGIAGQRTEHALRRYQKSQNLKSTGDLDRETMDRLTG